MEKQTVEKVTISQAPTGNVQTQTVTKSGTTFSEFFISKTNQIIFAIVGIISLLLMLRIIFFLLGANQVGIVSFILSITDVLVAPFSGIFSSPSSGSSFLDVAAIVAIVIYVVFGFILGIIIDLFSSETK